MTHKSSHKFCPNCDLKLIQRKCDPPDIIHCPKCAYNTIRKNGPIEMLYMVIGVDENGDEGLIAAELHGVITALMSQSKDMVMNHLLTSKVVEIAKQKKLKVYVAKFKRVS